MSKYLEINNNKGVIIDDNTKIDTIVPYTPEVDDYYAYGEHFYSDGIIRLGHIVGYYGIGRLITIGPHFFGANNNIPDRFRAYIRELTSDTLPVWSKLGADYRPSTSNLGMKITGNLKRPNEMRTTPLRHFTINDDNSTGNTGLQAFDDNGKLIFDSNKHYTSIIDVINFENFNGDYNKEYKYDVPIIIIPVSLSSWFRVRASGRSEGYNRSIIKKTFIQQTSPYSFNIGILEKSCDYKLPDDNNFDTFGQGNTSILVIDATSVFSQLEK